jgi:putative flippase GtrA
MQQEGIAIISVDSYTNNADTLQKRGKKHTMEKHSASKCISRILEFSFIGISTFIVQLCITLTLTEVVHIAYYFAYAAALVSSAFINFLLNRKITFKSIGKISASAERFLVLILGDIILNWSLVIFMVEALGIHYLLSIVIAAMMIAAANYYAEGKWVFK